MVLIIEKSRPVIGSAITLKQGEHNPLIRIMLSLFFRIIFHQEVLLIFRILRLDPCCCHYGN